MRDVRDPAHAGNASREAPMPAAGRIFSGAPLLVLVLLSCTGSGGAPVLPRQACARGGTVPMLLTGQADIVLCQGKT